MGDYGTIERETGNFQKEGNIYELSDATIANLVVQHKPVTDAPDNKVIIASAGVVHHELAVSAEV